MKDNVILFQPLLQDNVLFACKTDDYHDDTRRQEEALLDARTATEINADKHCNGSQC